MAIGIAKVAARLRVRAAPFGLVAILVACSAELPTPVPSERSGSRGAAESSGWPGLYVGLSESEQTYARFAVQRSLERDLKNQPRRWRHPTRGSQGLITPLRTYKSKTGHFCREFIEVVSRPNDIRSVTQKACRSRQGRWVRVVSEP